MEDKTDKSNSGREQLAKDLFSWQNRLMPWMILLPSLLILIFVYLSTVQLNNFSKEINNYKSSELDKVFVNKSDSSLHRLVTESPELSKLYLLAKMEEQLMNKRYSQGGVLLISRLYTKYLGFFTGMILAIVGAVFIISKLSEEQSSLTASGTNASLSLVSTSPGIIFAVLGTVLMLSTILSQTEIQITDAATYLNGPATTPININVKPNTPADTTNMDSLMKYSTPENP
ncbi:hypothetical protein [Dyadobacter fanqingshengii]|uniref:Uncharacterized protein n=1 Tax=Dyadobacter fanqingshengii TaxID=2906443 RepID=A0A9X1PAE6_9BACT|nr:hypothetical protein [Dyadobacter fanqingshengii]MCF0039765.1 hypothetical protein [Dyadobacter fanqingshengii]USJ38472.1 hypothetical protein NFI81_11955 [Dyadobacter fanqingshengii]